MRRRSLVATLVLATFVLSARSAVAQPATNCDISLAGTTHARGSFVVVRGFNFPTTPRTVPILLDGAAQRVGLATIDDAGEFAEPIRIPNDVSEGSHTLSVSCRETVVSKSIDVVASVGPPTTDDDDDGETRELLLVGGAGIVIALVLTARRRRDRVAAELVDAEVP